MAHDDDTHEIDDWFEEPGEPEPRSPRGARAVQLGGPDGDQRRLVIAAIAAAAVVLVLLIALLSLRGDGDDEAAEQQPPPPPAATPPPATGPETETGPATPPPPTLPEEGTIGPDADSEQVQALQQALIDLGYEPGEPDGSFGPATTEAVRSFQRDAELEPDGVAGPATLRAINEALAGQG